MFALFMRLLKPPDQSATTPGGSTSIIQGEALFTEVGCLRDEERRRRRAWANYADVVTKDEPLLTTRRHNTIPVRAIIDAKGRVKNVHLLSAFPEQAQVILAALRGWTFKPYRVGGRAVEVETGLVFGMPLVP